jgi:hypothetical protein
MNFKEYEAYIATVVQGLSICKTVEILRNRKYKGVRQPGNYEIDISCEIQIDNALSFLMIVECKNWKKPIDREQIQKFVQTRDAIAAHKAIFVSPVGYTREAIEVARVHGIALWVISESEMHVLAGGAPVAYLVSERMYKVLSGFIYTQLGLDEERDIYPYNPYPYNPQCEHVVLAPYHWLKDNQRQPDNFGKFRFDYYRGCPLGFRDPVKAETIAYIFKNLDREGFVCKEVANILATFLSISKSAGMSDSSAQLYLDALMKAATTDNTPFGSWQALSSFDESLNHQKMKLLAPVGWLECQGKGFLIDTAANDESMWGIKNNVVWANMAWLLQSHKIT